MMDKDILLFDLDGTLTDPKVGITRSVAFALDAGIHVKTEICEGIYRNRLKGYVHGAVFL